MMPLAEVLGAAGAADGRIAGQHEGGADGREADIAAGAARPAAELVADIAAATARPAAELVADIAAAIDGLDAAWRSVPAGVSVPEHVG